jgi:hypothetical protein
MAPGAFAQLVTLTFSDGFTHTLTHPLIQTGSKSINLISLGFGPHVERSRNITVVGSWTYTLGRAYLNDNWQKAKGWAEWSTVKASGTGTLVASGVLNITRKPPTYSASGNAETDGVKVTIGGRSAISGQNGVFKIEGLPAGNYTVTAEKFGCAITPSPQLVTITSDTSTVRFGSHCDTPTTFYRSSWMNYARSGHPMVRMLDGRLLVSGGRGEDGMSLAASEVYDPKSYRWTMVGRNLTPRQDHTMVLLNDGRVMAVGGVTSYRLCSANSSAEVFDPQTGVWSALPDVPFPVGTGHVALRLLDGRVLVIGGGNRCGSVSKNAAVYDPTWNSWVQINDMTTPREFFDGRVMADGRVLVVGGATATSFNFVPSAEIFDPTLSKFTPIGNMHTGRGTSCNGFLGSFLALLNDGILAAGGLQGSCAGQRSSTAATELLETNGAAWVTGRAMNEARSFTPLTVLADGQTVLVAGGFAADGTLLASSERYEQGNWTSSARMNAPRAEPAVVLTTNSATLNGSVNPGGYSAIGAFHYIFRRKFLAISMSRERAAAEGISVRWWDFLFYASFGFVVTSSVSIAGVLLVFCYLIVPSVAAMMFADRVGARLAIGWTMGTVVSMLGMYFSVLFDSPTGATIVCTFGLVLVLMALVRPLVRRGARA